MDYPKRKPASIYIITAIILFIFLKNPTVYATMQVLEKITYKDEVRNFFPFPLEKYLIKNNISLEKHLPNSRPSSCWRGYVGHWKIENEKLFLIKLTDYKIEKTASLNEIFGDKYIEYKVWADWYSGTLRIQKGNRIRDGYPGHGNKTTTEIEVVVEVVKGIVVEINEFQDEAPCPIDFKEGEHLFFQAFLPITLKPCADPDRYSVCYADENHNVTMHGKGNLYGNFKTPQERRLMVKNTLDSCYYFHDDNYKWKMPVYKKQRWGYSGWVDGYSHELQESIRIFVMSSDVTRLILYFRVKDGSSYKFEQCVNIISQSIVLNKLGRY